jgi:ATP-dependent DNA helicase PIF1
MNNETQQLALEYVLEGKNLFITGGAGVGKTFLIKEIKRQLENEGKKVAITSLTGMSALLIGDKAKTIHSWSGIGIGNRSVMDYFSFIRKCQPKVREAWRTTNTLIIDEISMMSDELFEKISELGKLIRFNPYKPFGGIQIICLGDFYQLPPINTSFVFESRVWNETIDYAIQLDKIYRQDDPVFQKMLNEIRLGIVSDETDTILKSRLNLDYSNEVIQPTKIYTRREMVEEENRKGLEKIEAESYTYKSVVKGKVNTDAIRTAMKKMDNSAPYVDELTLKVGAQVMLITNLDTEGGLVNGKLGIVKHIDPKFVMVQFKGYNYSTQIPYYSWVLENYDNVSKNQIPLVLAYAITIHKMQGSTLDSAYIDIGRSVFEYGQAYVALSRVKSLESLYLHDYYRGAIRAHPKVTSYYDSLFT